MALGSQGVAGAVAFAMAAIVAALALRGAWLARGPATSAAARIRHMLVLAPATAALWFWAAAPVAAWKWPAAVAAAQCALALAAVGPAGPPSAPRRGRWLAILGHGACTAAILLSLARPGGSVSAGPGAAWAPPQLAAAAGLSLLAVHAHWRQGARWPHLRTLDPLLLCAVAVAAGAVSLAVALQATKLAWPGSAALLPLADGVALACALPVAWTLGAPRRVPGFLRRAHAVAWDVAAHGAAAIALLNLLVLCACLVSAVSLRILVGVLLAWQILVIAVEVRTIHHAHRRRGRLLATASPPQRGRREPVTVIVMAANEAHVLGASLDHNLGVDYPLRFILVPATRSHDGTVAAAHALLQTHPARVAVVEGTCGSKAGDLNLAWKHATTRFVLVLDADETIDAAGIARAVGILRANPGIGLVQGRKASRTPHDGFLARLVSAERRYSTWMDQVMHSDTLGSSHFGGSAALIRRELPSALGGWSDRTLTEDIDFSLRVHLHGRWRIVCCPEMVVRESDPATSADLLRQRTRWARGWLQCFRLYFPDVVRRRRTLGTRRAFGLALLLLLSVSAMWSTFVPLSFLLRVNHAAVVLPLVVALPLTLIMLPSRLLAYTYAARLDPVIPLRKGWRAHAELALQAYLWILIGWFVQLHALYLEMSDAPRQWSVTGKRAMHPLPGGAKTLSTGASSTVA